MYVEWINEQAESRNCQDKLRWSGFPQEQALTQGPNHSNSGLFGK